MKFHCNEKRARSILLSLAGAIVGLVAVETNAASQEARPSNAVTGDLLTSLFSPVIAAEPKAMAVFQRTSLLDKVARSRSLELAFVVDATESMSK